MTPSVRRATDSRRSRHRYAVADQPGWEHRTTMHGLCRSEDPMESPPWDAKVLTPGQVAARSGVAVSALHFYEREGLIASSRTSGNQRRYTRDIRSEERRVGKECRDRGGGDHEKRKTEQQGQAQSRDAR